MSDEVRWNLRLKRRLYDQLEELSNSSGVSKADINRLALVKFLSGVGPDFSLKWVRTQLKQVEIQMEEAE